jgi:hypothetical protein
VQIAISLPFWHLTWLSIWSHFNLAKLRREDKIVFDVVKHYQDIPCQVLLMTYYIWMSVATSMNKDLISAISYFLFTIMLDLNQVLLFATTNRIVNMQLMYQADQTRIYNEDSQGDQEA